MDIINPGKPVDIDIDIEGANWILQPHAKPKVGEFFNICTHFAFEILGTLMTFTLGKKANLNLD